MRAELTEKLRETETHFNEHSGLPECDGMQTAQRRAIFEADRTERKARKFLLQSLGLWLAKYHHDY